MIPPEIYALARAIGKCGPDDEPDGECIGIAWQIAVHLRNNSFRVEPIANDPH